MNERRGNTTICFTRHGETTMNLEKRISGVTECDLTELGLAQAQELAEKCESMGDIDLILCSPQKRAQRTAGIVAERIHVPVITDKRLREWDYGTYENMPSGTDEFMRAKREFAVRMKGGGESVLQLAHRIYGFIEEAAVRYQGKTILCVCHGGVCRIAETYFRDMTTEEYNRFSMMNCEIRRYVI